MIVDFHTHILPPSVQKNRETYFHNEPAFELLYRPIKSKIIGATEIVNAMVEQGVDVSVVFGFPWRNIDTVIQQNDYILEAVSRYPKQLIGFCCVDPAHPHAAREVERCLSAGMSGVGELAFYESGIDETALDQLAPIMEICRQRQTPVLIHTNEPIGHAYPGKSPITLSEIYRLTQTFSENKIVLAHWGGGIFFYAMMKKEVKNYLANVFFDTAASPFLYDPDIYRVAAGIVGADKILFGSDYPLLGPRRYMKDIENNKLSDEEVKKICGTNAQKLLCIG